MPQAQGAPFCPDPGIEDVCLQVQFYSVLQPLRSHAYKAWWIPVTFSNRLGLGYTAFKSQNDIQAPIENSSVSLALNTGGTLFDLRKLQKFWTIISVTPWLSLFIHSLFFQSSPFLPSSLHLFLPPSLSVFLFPFLTHLLSNFYWTLTVAKHCAQCSGDSGGIVNMALLSWWIISGSQWRDP